MSNAHIGEKALAPLVLPAGHLDALRELVGQMVHAPGRQPYLFARLLARDALIGILDTALGDDASELDVDIAGGFFGDFQRQEIFAILDLTINGRLIAVYAVPDGAGVLWIPRPAIESGTAPDAWVIVSYAGMGATNELEALATPGRGDILTRVVGWLPHDEVSSRSDGNPALREVDVAGLHPPNTLVPFLRAGPGRSRAETRRPADTLRQAGNSRPPGDALAYSAGGAGQQPLAAREPISTIAPAIFDALVADVTLGTSYLAALEGDPAARALVEAPADWDVPPQISDELTDLFHQVFALLQARSYSEAVRLLAGTQAPELLHLRAAVYSLWGNMREAIADARAAYDSAPERALRLFGPVPRPHFAVAWQHVPSAAMSANDVVVIDALAPNEELAAEHDDAELHLVADQVIFSLAVQLSSGYAGSAFRVFVVADELRRRLNLVEPGAFRAAFAYNGATPPSELEHVLVVHTSVLTEDDDLLGGVVADGGLISLWQPVRSAGRPRDGFFHGKTVVVALYPEDRKVDG